MRIVCVSDTHREHHMLNVPDGDVLIHAGDFTDWGSLYDVVDISEWFNAQSHPCKILIAGNHDVCFQSKPEMSKAALRKSCHYLENQEFSDIVVQTDSDMLDTVKHWKMKRVGEGKAFELADVIAWFNQRHTPIEHCKKMDLRDSIKSSMEQDLLR